MGYLIGNSEPDGNRARLTVRNATQVLIRGYPKGHTNWNHAYYC